MKYDSPLVSDYRSCISQAVADWLFTEIPNVLRTDYRVMGSDVPESFLWSQSHVKFFRVESGSNHDLVRSESQELSVRFELLVCQFDSMSRQMKFNISPMIFYYKLVPNEPKNGSDIVTRVNNSTRVTFFTQ